MALGSLACIIVSPVLQRGNHCAALADPVLWAVSGPARVKLVGTRPSGDNRSWSLEGSECCRCRVSTALDLGRAASCMGSKTGLISLQVLAMTIIPLNDQLWLVGMVALSGDICRYRVYIRRGPGF